MKLEKRIASYLLSGLFFALLLTGVNSLIGYDDGIGMFVFYWIGCAFGIGIINESKRKKKK